MSFVDQSEHYIIMLEFLDLDGQSEFYMISFGPNCSSSSTGSARCTEALVRLQHMYIVPL